MKSFAILQSHGRNDEREWIDRLRDTALKDMSEIQDDETRKMLEERFAQIDRTTAKYYVAAVCFLVLNATCFILTLVGLVSQNYLMGIPALIVMVLSIPCAKSLVTAGWTEEQRQLTSLYSVIAYALTSEQRDTARKLAEKCYLSIEEDQ